MPTNDYLSVATGGGANVETQAAYAADPLLPVGNQPGIAKSSFVNKALRQSSYFVANFAQFLCNFTGLNMQDDATPANILAVLTAAFKTAPTVVGFTGGSGTYTPPATALYLKVKMFGGGAGGAGSGSSPGAGSNGGNTTFGASLIASGATARSGGGVTFSGVTMLSAVAGQNGGGGSGTNAVTLNEGGDGGASPLGGAGRGGALGFVSEAAVASTGSGGGGASSPTGVASGNGGGAGAYMEFIIPLPAAGSYNYSVGSGGAGGTGTSAGAAGSAGRIIVEEHYN
jgi:hypothetical protein